VKKNLFIVALMCVVVVLVAMMWFKEDLKKDSVEATLSTPISHINEVSAKVESQKTTKAPIVPKSKVDEKLEKLGFGNSADVHKITVK